MISIRTFIAMAVVLGLYGCGGAESNPTTQSSSAPSSADAAAVSDAHPGKEIYQNYCFSCHLSGLSGAPKLGDVEAWAPRIAKGRDLLLQTTIAGVQPAMPPRGMCFDCSDEELGAVVDYMIEQSQ